MNPLHRKTLSHTLREVASILIKQHKHRQGAKDVAQEMFNQAGLLDYLSYFEVRYKDELDTLTPEDQ